MLGISDAVLRFYVPLLRWKTWDFRHVDALALVVWYLLMPLGLPPKVPPFMSRVRRLWAAVPCGPLSKDTGWNEAQRCVRSTSFEHGP